MKPIRSEMLLKISRDRLKLANDSALMTSEEISNHFDAALRLHSFYNPNVKVVFFDGGVRKYPLPADWISGISKIVEIKFQSGGRYAGDRVKPAIDIYDTVDTTQYDIGNVSTDDTDVTLDTPANANSFKDGDVISLLNNAAEVETNWADADGNTTTGVLQLRFPAEGNYTTSPTLSHRNYFYLRHDEPESTDLLQVYYGTIHTYTDTDSEITVSEGECESVADLAAALAARALSSEFSKGAISSIEADSFDSNTNAERWSAIAEYFEKSYRTRMGIKEPETP